MEKKLISLGTVLSVRMRQDKQKALQNLQNHQEESPNKNIPIQ